MPVDEQGLRVGDGIELAHDARLVYTTPSNQYPITVTMSLSRRLELLEWAQRSGSWIIEDDYDSEFRYNSRPIAALQGLDRNSRVILSGNVQQTTRAYATNWLFGTARRNSSKSSRLPAV